MCNKGTFYILFESLKGNVTQHWKTWMWNLYVQLTFVTCDCKCLPIKFKGSVKKLSNVSYGYNKCVTVALTVKRNAFEPEALKFFSPL